jgi:2-methylcitrate dehydratase PrpD
MDYQDLLAEFVFETKLKNIRGGVVDRAKLIFLDTLGVCINGSQSSDYIANLAKELSGKSKDPMATIVGHPYKADPLFAAMVNGISTTSIELDEGNQEGRTHASSHVLPVCLALGEQENAGGVKVLEGYILGTDVAIRIGASARSRNLTHPHGTAGLIGAAAASSKMFGFQPREIREILNIATGLTLATSFTTASDGGFIRNMYVGHAAWGGFFSTLLMRCGFTGEREGVRNVFGRTLSDSFDEKKITEHLGERYGIESSYVKMHAYCRTINGALDALQLIKKKLPFEKQEVDRIEVYTCSLPAFNFPESAKTKHPCNMLAAKFSLVWAVSAYLVLGTSGVDGSSEKAIQNREVHEFTDKISVEEDPSFTAMTPTRMPTRIKVFLEGGRVLDETIFFPKGGPEDPYTAQEIERKFMDLATPVLREKKARRVKEKVKNLEELESIRVLASFLKP